MDSNVAEMSGKRNLSRYPARVGKETWGSARPRMRRHKVAFLSVFLAIAVSTSWIANMGANWLQYTLLLMFLILALIANIGKTWSIFPMFSAAFIVMGLGFVSVVRPGGFGPTDLLLLANIVLGYLLAMSFENEYRRSFATFVRVLYILCVSSLILYPLIFTLPEMIWPVPDYMQSFFEGTYREQRRFFTVMGISYFVSERDISDIWRNQSIFWEPGMLGFVALIGLVLSDALGGKAKERIVFVAAIVSSFAPGAYALFAIYIALRFLNVSKRGVFVSGLYVLGILASAALSIAIIREVVLAVFSRDILVDSSVVVRTVDFWLPYKVAQSSPFFGHSDISAYQIAMSQEANIQMLGMTNSIGAYFYRYGYVFTTGFLIWSVYVFSRAGRIFSALPFILFIGVMYQPIGFTALFFFFLFVAASSGGARRGAEQKWSTSKRNSAGLIPPQDGHMIDLRGRF